MVIRSWDAAECIRKIACNMTNVDISTDNMFMDEYVQASSLPHTDIELFPSAKKRLQERNAAEQVK